eukprot:1157276-Pelagomonas_calceolata.AAC.4
MGNFVCVTNRQVWASDGRGVVNKPMYDGKAGVGCRWQSSCGKAMIKLRLGFQYPPCGVIEMSLWKEDRVNDKEEVQDSLNCLTEAVPRFR